MDAGNDILAVAGERDLTGKDAPSSDVGPLAATEKGRLQPALDDNTCVARASEV